MTTYSTKCHTASWKAEATNGWVVVTAWLLWTKEWCVCWVGWSRTAWAFIPVLRIVSNLKLINCLFLELFIYYFCARVDHGQLKTVESETAEKRDYCQVFLLFSARDQLGPFPSPLWQRAAGGDSWAGLPNRGHLSRLYNENDLGSHPACRLLGG